MNVFGEPTATLLCGDCIERLAQMPENSVDSVVCDPPYHFASIVKRFGAANAAPAQIGATGAYERASRGFMGKEWDGGDIAFRPETWAAVMRVLKPGGHLLAFGSSKGAHRMVCAIEDAGFEIRDTLMWLYGCLDDKTEVLTRRGWLLHTDLTPDDEVMQWDSTTGTLSWTRPSEVLVFPFDGEMVTLENRHTRQVLTPNHRVYAKVRRHSRHPKASSYEVLDASVIANRPSSWAVDLPMAGDLQEGENVDPDFAYLVGWWLTDAWVHGDGKAAMFSQCKSATLDRLRAALALHDPSEYVKQPREPQHQPEHTFYVTGTLADRLIGGFPQRDLTWSMLGWDAAARRRLVDGLMDGDGSYQDAQHGGSFWSQDAARRDVFLALALSIGWRAYDDAENACVYVNWGTSTTQIQGKHRSAPYRYQGNVWCLVVPHKAFVVRREGRPFITGNTGFPKSHDVSKGIDAMLGAERKVVSEGAPVKRMIPGADQHKDGSWIKGNGRVYVPTVTAAGSPEAAAWEGWGTALKPAFEPIVMARKPLSGTVAANVLAHGTGAINIDGCRVPSEGGKMRGDEPSAERRYADKGATNFAAKPGPRGGDPEGRFPANVLHDGSDEVVSAFPQSAGQQGKVGGQDPVTNVYGDFGPRPEALPRGDNGSAARFFWSPKASKTDRADSKHPTVKPVALMRYLCRLVTPPGGTVLDPFAGSGTTGQAALAEGFDAILIEREAEYQNDIRRRLGLPQPVENVFE